MTQPPMHHPDPEYIKALNRVAQNMYSLEPHFCRWEEASTKEKSKYVRQAHLARVWWDMHYKTDQTGEKPL